MTAPLGPPGTRDVILAAAETEFGDRGYRGATIERIATGAGVSRPLVYRYFTDKPGLYQAVVGRVLREWNEALVEVAGRPSPSTRHTLAQLVRACLQWSDERDILRGVLLRDADVAQRIAADVFDEGRDLLPTLLAQVLERGVAAGEIRADLAADDMAFVIAEVIISGATQMMASGGTALAPDRIEAMVETVLHGVVLPANVQA